MEEGKEGKEKEEEEREGRGLLACVRQRQPPEAISGSSSSPFFLFIIFSPRI